MFSIFHSFLPGDSGGEEEESEDDVETSGGTKKVKRKKKPKLSEFLITVNTCAIFLSPALPRV